MLVIFVGYVQAGRATVAVQKPNETYKEWSGTSYPAAHESKAAGYQNTPQKQVSHFKFGQGGQRAAVNEPRKLAHTRSDPQTGSLRDVFSVPREETKFGKGNKKPHIHAQSPSWKIVPPHVQPKKPREDVKKEHVSGESLVGNVDEHMSNGSWSPKGYIKVELPRERGYTFVRHIKPDSDKRRQMSGVSERASSDRCFNLDCEYSSRKHQRSRWRLFHPHRAQSQGKFRPFQRLLGDYPRHNEYLSSNTSVETTGLSTLNSTSVTLSPGDLGTISTAPLLTEGHTVGFEQNTTEVQQNLDLPTEEPNLQTTENVTVYSWSPAEVGSPLRGTEAADDRKP